MSIIHFLISFLFGLLPESLFFTLFLINIKQVKTKKLLLFLLISLDYLVFIIFNNHILVSYILFTVILTIILKILYKKELNIVDIFFIIYSEIYLSLLSFICFKFVKSDYSNYYFIAIINRIIIFSFLFFKKHILNFYIKYCKFWNRNNNEKRPIKSITLRNISIVILNMFIFINYLIFTYINSIVR